VRLTVSEIASLVGGTVRGDGAVVIEGAAGLGEATPRDLSFLANPKYKSQLETTRAGALLGHARGGDGRPPRRGR
jgi:UDP-3-O-[3-hydroxymyristoyl] glucosamine N-acyltransferase